MEAFQWKVRTLRQFGLAHLRSTLMTLPPSLNFTGEVWLRDAQRGVQFPVALRAGVTSRLPHVRLERRSDKPRQPRVAIHLDSGRVVQAEVLSADAFEPMDVDTEYRVHADFEFDVRSDEGVREADGSDGPTRVSTSVRNRGAGQMHVVTHVEPPESE